jgi:phosphoglycerate dehydrogenase-like enzyme
MSAFRCLVIYPPLHTPLTQLAPSDVDYELKFVPYEITDEVRTARRADPKVPHPAEPSVSDELADALAWADALACLDAPRDLRGRSASLRWVQALGSGVEQFRASLDATSGLALTNGAGLGAGAIAEWVVGRILEHYKRFGDHRRQQEQHLWQRCFGRQLPGAHVLIIGTGAIGVACAARLAPFGVYIHGVRADPAKGTGHPAITEVCGPEQLSEALGRADIVVLAAGSNQAGAMIGAAEFAAMRDGAFFVNVARGSMVDEDAMVAALTSGHLSGVATDVSAAEPLPADSPLWDVPGLVISPHSSVSQDGMFHAGAQRFWDNARRLVAGEPLDYAVDVSSW